MPDTVWVTKQGAALKTDAAAAAETAAELNKGEKLTVIAEEEKWLRVSPPSGAAGWIYRGNVSKYPPAEDGETADDLFDAPLESDIGIDADDTSRSMRG